MLNQHLEQTGKIRLKSDVENVSFSTTGGTLLAACPNRFDGYSFDRDGVKEFTLRTDKGIDPLSVLLRHNELFFADCDADPLLRVVDRSAGKRVAEHPLPPFMGAGYMLFNHPENEAIGIVAYSGQSEEMLYWAHYANGRLNVFMEPEIADVSAPIFHPNGGEFVSRHESLGLCRGSFPSGEILAHITPEDAFASDHGFSYDIVFSKEGQFLAQQESLALYEFDLESLRPIRPVLEGVDGKLFGDDSDDCLFSGQFWKLCGNRLLTTDRCYNAGLENDVQTLRAWTSPELFEPVAGPAPSRPHTRRLLAIR